MACLLAAMIAFTAPATAQEEDPDWYSVELIVFLHRDDAAMVEERWAPDTGYPEIKHAVDLVAPTVPAVLQPYEQVPPNARRLRSTLRTLARSARYQPLLHTGWRQPGLSRDNAVAVRIDDRAGEPLQETELEVELPPEPNLGFAGAGTVPGREMGTELEAGTARELDPALLAKTDRKRTMAGTVRFYEQRYLHLEMDILYVSDTELEAEAPGELSLRTPEWQAFRLRESRRIGAGELHYFDHPRFGVIAIVHQMDEEEVESRRENYENAFRAALLEREAARLREQD